MKKSQMYKKVNRKTKIFNHVNRNVVHPTIYFNPYRDEEVYNKAIQITELTSDEDASDNEQQNNNNHEWCNITDRSQEKEDNYEVNTSARDKRRQNNEYDYRENYIRSEYNDEDVLNQFCTDFYGIDFHDRSEGISTVNNIHPEFIKIINNSHRASDTSSDSNQYDNIEVIQCADTKENDYWNSNDLYDSRNINDDGDAEKRTIWIYALKNQRYLSEHDYELINISSKDSTSTTDDDDLIKDIPHSRRIAAPIPTYIPRMNFSISPTLPTVTEVTEPNKQPSNNSDISTKSADKTTHIQKSLNGWFENETIEIQNIEQNSEKMETNYENNLQALTPREKRRLRQTKINEQNIPDTKIEPETHVYCEPKIIIRNKEFSPELQIDNFKKQIDEIDHEGDQDNGLNGEKEVSLEHSKDCTMNDSLCNLQKPRITVSSEIKTFKKDITDPIEKLDGNWIGDSLPNDTELFEVYDYDITATENNDEAKQRTGGAIEETASDRLFIRNMSLLKPAEWTQYLPLTGSVPSLHLSLSVDTDFDTEKKSWFKRFIQFVHCCK